MANLECNAVSAVQVTHLLLGRMRAKKLRGCFVYTSSGGQRCGISFRTKYQKCHLPLAHGDRTLICLPALPCPALPRLLSCPTVPPCRLQLLP